LRRAVAGVPAPGFRALLLHDVPEHHFAVLDAFVARVRRDHGVLTPEQAADWLDAGTIPKDGGPSPCLFTFDDGFASNHAVARQILDAQGVKALFFVCPGLVDAPPVAQEQHLAETVFDGGLAGHRRLMTWDEIAELAAHGHAVGAHAMTHRRLSRLDGDTLRREIVDAGDRLAARLRRPVPWFAYPFGDIDSISPHALALIAGHYRYCRSGVRGANRGTTARCAVRADHIDLEAPPAYRALAVDGGLDFRYREARHRLDAMQPRD
jgi:peptidoglycan/xylan/chitin deacetylase (PgdA/CDA1 family)